MTSRFWSRIFAWLRGGRVVLEIEVGERSLLATCRFCGRSYTTPPTGVLDSGTCWLCRVPKEAA